MFVEVFADIDVRTHHIYFSSSQMFHNSCELPNVYLGLGPGFFIFITFLVDASVGVIPALPHSRYRSHFFHVLRP
jgi:hypothetical protein